MTHFYNETRGEGSEKPLLGEAMAFYGLMRCFREEDAAEIIKDVVTLNNWGKDDIISISKDKSPKILYKSGKIYPTDMSIVDFLNTSEGWNMERVIAVMEDHTTGYESDVESVEAKAKPAYKQMMERMKRLRTVDFDSGEYLEMMDHVEEELRYKRSEYIAQIVGRERQSDKHIALMEWQSNDHLEQIAGRQRRSDEHLALMGDVSFRETFTGKIPHLITMKSVEDDTAPASFPDSYEHLELKGDMNTTLAFMEEIPHLLLTENVIAMTESGNRVQEDGIAVNSSKMPKSGSYEEFLMFSEMPELESDSDSEYELRKAMVEEAVAEKVRKELVNEFADTSIL